jgi:transposase
MLLSEGQMSDYKGAALMIDALPKARALLGDRGYDADWFRHALTTRGITPCIPSKANRKIPIPHDRTLYRQRHRIENMFGRLKDWRRVLRRGKRTPFEGVIGAQKGPPLAMGFTMVPVLHGGLDWDVGFGDGREDPPGVFRSEEDDQGDLPRAESFAEGGAEGSAVGRY